MAIVVAIALLEVRMAKMPMAAIVVAEEEVAKTVEVMALMARRPSRTAVLTTPAAMATVDARPRLARTMVVSIREVKVRETCSVVEVLVALALGTTVVVPTTTTEEMKTDSVAVVMMTVRDVAVVVEAEEVVVAVAIVETVVVTAVATEAPTEVPTAVITRMPSEWLSTSPCA